MPSAGSVSAWIEAVKHGDSVALAALSQRYFNRLAGVARVRLRDANGFSEDEEDIALSAFFAFWQGAVVDQFPDVHTRDQLWRVLAAITVHKALKLIRKEHALKRNSQRKVDEAGLNHLVSESGIPGLDGLIGSELPADLVAQTNDVYNRIIGELPDELRCVLQSKLQGSTNVEIAKELGCTLRTVERRLERIRKRVEKWFLLEDEQE